MPDAPLAVGAYGGDVAQLQGALLRLGFSLPESEISRRFFGPATRQAVRQLQLSRGLPVSGEVDDKTAAGLTAVPAAAGQQIPASASASSTSVFSLAATVPLASQRGAVDGGHGQEAGGAGVTVSYAISGIVAHPTSAGVGGLTVQIVDKNAGPDVPLTQSTTNDDGSYAVTFAVPSALLAEHGKTQPDLQARVLLGSTVLAASDVRYSAPPSLTLNVTIPANVTTLPGEYETLTRMLAPLYRGRLGTLQEGGGRTDITYLANKTGWDARAVALAALADQFAANSPSTAGSSGTIQPEFYYALFRAGMPANADQLYRTSQQTASTIWTQAIADGVIPASLSEKVAGALEAFQKLSAATALDAVPAPDTSSMRSLLQLTLGDDEKRQGEFADLYTQYQEDLPGFWAAVQQAFGEATTKRLQLDGQLGVLTLNNAPLLRNLHQAESAAPLTSLLDLVRRGYYQASKWEPLMTGVPAVPAPGATPGEKQSNYVALLTAQLRLSYPTAVLAEMVNTGEIPLAADPAVQTGVYQFLVQNQGNYELGVQPLDQYLVGNGLQGKVGQDVVAQIKRLQRVYQVTPSDQAMIALLARNTDSAYQIVSYGKQAFVAEFQDAMGGAGAAELTYAKAQRVYNAVLNLTTDYILRGRTPVLGSGGTGYLPGFGGSAATNPAASATLQTLFNNLDYCACEECRSILGPAAYLVDLLNFTDRPASGGSQDPQSLLFARRPDLQYLPFTCANTNTALPYIDVVNEILEAFAADGSLASFQGFSTDDSVTSAELLAIPQNVNHTAYENLLKAFFPPPLPFHRQLELLRRLFQQFGVRLADAMYLLRPSDAIEAPTGGYGWRDILLEQFGCSRQEQQILANSVITLEDQLVSLAQLYGYPAAQPDQDTAAKLSSVPDFAARTGVSYENLVSILQTSFINPNAYLIPLLEKLNVSFTVLQQLKSGAITPADFAKYLPQGTVALDPADYGGNIAGWILDPARYAQIMGLVTITNTNSADPDLCSMANLEFKYSDPSPAATLQPGDFLRLIRFIRLWRKLSTAMPQLGNVIARTDDIITALTAGADLRGDTQLLDAGFFGLLPRIGVLSQVMSLLGLGSDRDVQSLLACWAPIGTSGSDSLYASMFLTPAQLQADPAFAPGPDGSVLTDTSKMLPDHETALRAAFGLTHAEFAAISTQLGYTGTTQLTLANISAVYRRAWLARALQISVTELLLLLNNTGLDPFTAPDPSSTGPAEPAMIRLIRLVQAMQNASLEPVQALYLLWNQDINGNSAPADADIAALALSLRTDFLAVDSQFAVQDDPTGAITQSLLTLVYGSSAAGFFAGLLNNTFSVSAPYAGAVPPAVTAASGDQPVPGPLPRLSYDGVALQLTFTGILDPATFTAMQTAAAGIAPLLTALSQLQSASQAATGPFFTQYPELQQALAAYLASADPVQTKRDTLLAGLLPALQAERRQQQALAAITAAAGVDGTFGTALLTGAAVLHSAAQAAVGGSPKTGDMLTTTINGAAITYTVTASTAVTAVAAAIAATINAAASPDPVSGQPLNAVLRASANGGAVTIRTMGHGQLPAIAFAASSGAGATYTAGPAIGDLTALDAQGLTGQFFLSNNPSGPPDQTADADPALSYSPTATVGQTPAPGDVLTTTINGVPVKYQVASTDTTAAAIAGQIASAINAATDPDPVSGLALNAVVKASANGPVVVIEAVGPGSAPGVGCAVSPGATESYVPGTQLPGGGPGPVAGTWSGYVAAPQDGEYFFAVTTDAGAAVALTIGGAEVPVTQDGSLWRSGPVPLIAGSLTAITMTAAGLRANLSLSWQSKGIGLQLIPAGCMYSQTLMDRLRATYTRFLKATSLASSLSVDAAELVFLTQDSQLQVHGQGWPSALAVAGNPDATSAVQFCDVLTGLLAFARLKHALSPRDDRLLDALQDLRSQLGQGPPYDTGKLIALTRWDPDSLTSLLQRFAALTGGDAPPVLSHVANLARVYDAYRVVKACGVAAAALLAAATNDPAAAMVATFQAALAARYAASDWLAVIKPINDAMRGLQRDALVPYVLQLLAARSPAAMVDVDTPVTTPDALYEYLLADVAMDPCLQTSRIQFAIAAVQLFIERSLRALETSSNPALNVDPAVFGPDAPAEWSWMKRYRVWQANREVFLWPENWAYPELRDDQTPEFTTIMGKLLQSDITDDSAATAYLDYLTDLEKIAKLETCGMYYVPASTSPPADEVTHVIARSTGASRTYYYRAYDGVSWSPWEEIPLKIPDNPVLPVVWNNRLLLFWLQVVPQQAPGSPAAPDDSQGPTLAQAHISDVVKSIGAVTPSVQVQLTLFWSEYCKGKWQQAKSSDPNNPALLGQYEYGSLIHSFGTTFSAGAVQQFDLALTAYPETYPPGGHQDRLWIVIWLDGQPGADFLFYNTHSSPVADVADSKKGLSFPTRYLAPSNYERQATVAKSGELELDYSSSGESAGFSTYLLTGRLPSSIVEPQHPMRGDTSEATWLAPFCFSDTANAFYVEASIDWLMVIRPGPARFAGYGVTAHLPSLARRVAPLALRGPAQASAQVPRRQDPANTGQTLAAVDGSRLGSFVQKDPYISRALGTTGIVRYGSISIGATGAVADAEPDGKGET